MTSWENPVPVAVFLSSGDLENRASLDNRNALFIDDARSRTFDAVCTPLTTAKWRERWRGMCIISSSDGERGEGSEPRAEAWRANPAFELGEVTMTCLGLSFFFFRSLAPVCLLTTGLRVRVRVYCWSVGSEEGDGVIVMVSDWLELDASDSWVRHDSEIVSVHHLWSFPKEILMASVT
jgi:protein arginine N-methyltransferase 5